MQCQCRSERQGRPRILRRTGHVGSHPLASGELQPRRHRYRDQCRTAPEQRRHRRPCPQERSHQIRLHRRQRGVRQRLRLAFPQGQRPLPERLPPEHRHRQTSHRQEARRGRKGRGSEVHRTRMHRQGKRPGQIRCRYRLAGPQPLDHRTYARVGHHQRG